MSKLLTIITLVGPTASGKTSLGVDLAKKFNGEIISADSRQVYKGLDLGTGKEGIRKSDKFQNPNDKKNDVNCQLSRVKCSARWIEGVPQYLIDIKNPEERFNVGEWKELAEAIIEDIVARGKQVFIVGGTGLYVNALVENYQFAGRGQKPKGEKKYHVLQIGVKLPRAELYQRIDQRVDDRLEQGMFEEVQGLLDQGVDPEWLINLGLEYKYLTEYLIGRTPNQEEAIQKLKYASHQYARRQLIWLRYHGQISWVKSKEEASQLVSSFLNSK